jgi:hypothetical protein
MFVGLSNTDVSQSEWAAELALVMAASLGTPPRAGRLSCPPPRHRGHPLPATSVADLPPLLRPTGSSSYYLRLAAGVQGSSKLVIVILMLV